VVAVVTQPDKPVGRHGSVLQPSAVKQYALEHGLPVLDGAGTLLGEVDIVHIRKVLFRIELYHHFTAAQLMEEPVATLLDTAPMSNVMKTFERTGAEWLPVVDTSNHLKGYISRQRLYTLYRKMVHDMSED
jgi:CIC family chloride channel protein